LRSMVIFWAISDFFMLKTQVLMNQSLSRRTEATNYGPMRSTCERAP
jgi:hypothetical protein